MCWQAKNKMLGVSLSLAAAGILACIAAVYDSFVPKGSLGAFLATMLPLGLLVAGIVVTFVWLCERFEGYSQRRSEQPFKVRPPEYPTPGERRRHFLDEIERHRSISPFPISTVDSDRYLGGVRGPAQPRKTSAQSPPLVRQWHGQ